MHVHNNYTHKQYMNLRDFFSLVISFPPVLDNLFLSYEGHYNNGSIITSFDHLHGQSDYGRCEGRV